MKIFLFILFMAAFSKCDPQGTPDANKHESESTPASNSNPNSNSDSNNGQPDASTVQTPLYKYKYLFAQHRGTQLEAVKRIVSFDDNTRRYDLVNMMLKQIFKTTEDAKNNITSWGFLPGDPFPENITILEGVTKILENTALFGDMVLRLPDIVHDIYDRQKGWQVLLAWAYGFCTQSNVFEGPNLQLLNLMAQEVNIIPQEPTYHNPFKAINQQKEKQQNTQSGKPEPEKKKSKKKLPRGPRMSHSEL